MGKTRSGNAGTRGVPRAGWQAARHRESGTIDTVVGRRYAATLGDLPTASWRLPYPLILSTGSRFGVQRGRFGFVISWAEPQCVVVEACTDLANRQWFRVETPCLYDGWAYFSEALASNYDQRFYRVRMTNGF